MRARHLVATIAPSLATIAMLVVVWQVSVRVGNVSQLVLPAPSDIAANLADHASNYIDDAGITLGEAFLGFAIALVVGVAAAAAMVHSRLFRRAFDPIQTALRCTPVVALAPALALWLGFGTTPKVIVASLITFPPFVVNAAAGFSSVDSQMLEVLQSVDASKREIFMKLRLPSAMPYLFSAAKVCVALALIGAVVGEWAASSQGLGYRIIRAQKDLETTTVWGAITVLAAMGIAFTLVVSIAERRMLNWDKSWNKSQ